MKKIYKSHAVADTQHIAKEVAPILKEGGVVCLYGELGAGKTTFSQTLLKDLGITSRITSPTFVMMRQYRVSDRYIYHVDAYRLDGITRNDAQSILELFSDSKDIVVIEWADRIQELLPERRIDIDFQYSKKDDERTITVFNRE